MPSWPIGMLPGHCMQNQLSWRSPGMTIELLVFAILGYCKVRHQLLIYAFYRCYFIAAQSLSLFSLFLNLSLSLTLLFFTCRFSICLEIARFNASLLVHLVLTQIVYIVFCYLRYKNFILNFQKFVYRIAFEFLFDHLYLVEICFLILMN